jgi:hypothetical protein
VDHQCLFFRYRIIEKVALGGRHAFPRGLVDEGCMLASFIIVRIDKGATANLLG